MIREKTLEIINRPKWLYIISFLEENKKNREAILNNLRNLSWNVRTSNIFNLYNGENWSRMANSETYSNRTIRM